MIRTKRVILAAGTMNTLRLLFVSSLGAEWSQPNVISWAYLWGQWRFNLALGSKSPLNPRPSSPFRCLAAIKVDGQDIPFIWYVGLGRASILCRCRRALKKKLARTVPSHRNGCGHRKRIGTDSSTTSLLVDYDHKQQPVFDKIREAIGALEAPGGLKTWAIKTPITVHAWGGACRALIPMRRRRSQRRGLWKSRSFRCGRGRAASRRRRAAFTYDRRMGSSCGRSRGPNSHVKLLESGRTNTTRISRIFDSVLSMWMGTMGLWLVPRSNSRTRFPLSFEGRPGVTGGLRARSWSASP